MAIHLAFNDTIRLAFVLLLSLLPTCVSANCGRQRQHYVHFYTSHGNQELLAWLSTQRPVLLSSMAMPTSFPVPLLSAIAQIHACSPSAVGRRASAVRLVVIVWLRTGRTLPCAVSLMAVDSLPDGVAWGDERMELPVQAPVPCGTLKPGKEKDGEENESKEANDRERAGEWKAIA